MDDLTRTGDRRVAPVLQLAPPILLLAQTVPAARGLQASGAFHLPRMRRFGVDPTAATTVMMLENRSSPRPIPSSSETSSSPPWRCAEIDYSAANEYAAAHYPAYDYNSSGDGERYFDVDRAAEPIYNARRGVVAATMEEAKDEDLALSAPSLDGCGFALLGEFDSIPAALDDDDFFRNREAVLESYLPVLRSRIVAELESGGDDKVSHLVFWHPMYRGEGVEMSQLRVDGSGSNGGQEGGKENNGEAIIIAGKGAGGDLDEGLLSTAPVASLAHVDTDFGAMIDTTDVVNLIGANRFEERGRTFPEEEIVSKIDGGHRFAIINAWRSADRMHPVSRAPLGILSTRFVIDDGVEEQKEAKLQRRDQKRIPRFPDDRPDRNRSRWHCFPRMAPDECLLFKQYDRRLDRPSELWHCALDVAEDNDGLVSRPRRSFDVRAFVVFEEKVPAELDRFGPDRTRPVLTREESGCFCEEQEEKRR